jgi:hypothetical protein
MEMFFVQDYSYVPLPFMEQSVSSGSAIAYGPEQVERTRAVHTSLRRRLPNAG